ncbi:MAG TPA: DUF6152 family protein [Alteraurantiacibacter sp.]|jgi:hypothetical protein
MSARLGVLSGATGVALAASLGTIAWAHHSFSVEFDASKPLTIEGKVIRFEWVNPHSWIHIDTVDPKTNKKVVWRVEGGAPSTLLRRGWNRNSLPAGTRIKVDGFASHDGDTRASAAEITFPDGRQLSLGNPATEAIAAAAKRSKRK